MKHCTNIGIRHVLLAFSLFGGAMRAELPLLMKQPAEAFDREMAAYDAACEAQVKNARDVYALVLAAARKRSEGAKRPAEVAAIDTDLKAVNAGPLPKEPPAGLPAELSVYRVKYIEAPERAAKLVAASRKSVRERYLKGLAEMASVAARLRDAALEAAVAGEQKRVLAREDKN